jgi:hypothetical protein
MWSLLVLPCFSCIILKPSYKALLGTSTLCGLGHITLVLLQGGWFNGSLHQR